ncbi:hypothetical protein DOTSEDRAFT_39645 [Dothistroma septosporum NZE10]|uniref:Uncharacterized protein n=1 Tax=Dothistroma septosporum (strain NZE10 / CBS 128990) TaxID=675120 RepID=M2YHY4_DOTSN|nr:hypothetical protein DOTSEDRAFT_39645 [Dothistroma septosporum NZE10]
MNAPANELLREYMRDIACLILTHSRAALNDAWTTASLDTRIKLDAKITWHDGPELCNATHLHLNVSHDGTTPDFGMNHIRIHGARVRGAPKFENIMHVCPRLVVLQLHLTMENDAWVNLNSVALGIALDSFLAKTVAAVPGLELWVKLDDAVSGGVVSLVRAQTGQTTVQDVMASLLAEKSRLVQVFT